ncbi:hypothetical protein AB01_2329 [Escherichia coli 2-177-06_S1_C1]|nr:hypothetical protein AB01_2329 [Escherichia coli 2-177-06_S1_C1]
MFQICSGISLTDIISRENKPATVTVSHENVPPDVVKPAGVVMKTTHHLHRHNNRGET